MITVNPTVTWPNHTSIVTGVKPARHSVIYNGMFVREGEPGESGRSIRGATNRRWSPRPPFTTLPIKPDSRPRKSIGWHIYHAPTITWSAPEVLEVNGKVEQEMIAAGLISREDVEHFREKNITWRDEIWTQATIHILRQHLIRI